MIEVTKLQILLPVTVFYTQDGVEKESFGYINQQTGDVAMEESDVGPAVLAFLKSKQKPRTIPALPQVDIQEPKL